MNETVSVDQAISKGHKMVTYPGMVIMVSLLGLTLFFGSIRHYSAWFWAVGMLISFGAPWLYWSVMITKWRFWAFENVRNVHELKKRAIQEKLIWADDDIFGRTEIRSTAEKEKWGKIQEKFNRKDEFLEDYAIPRETIICFSKGKNLVEFAIMAGMSVFGLYLIIKQENEIIGAIFLLVGIFYGFKEFKKVINKVPQIIVSDKGIQTISTPFFEWKDIRDEEIIPKEEDDQTRYYLSYHHPGGTEKLKIDEYDLDYKKITKLLILYRGRNNKTNNEW